MLEMYTASPAANHQPQLATYSRLRVNLSAFQPINRQVPAYSLIDRTFRVHLRYLTPTDWKTIRFLSFAMAFDDINTLDETSEPLLSKPASEWQALAMGLRHPSNRYLLLGERDQPFGATYYRQCSAMDAEIGDVWVAPAARRRGLAQILLMQALNELKDRDVAIARLWVAEHNAPAQSLYQQIGFVPTARKVRSANDAFNYHEFAFLLDKVG